MNWLFGHKKNEGKVEEAREATQVVDGFVAYPPIPDIAHIHQAPHHHNNYPSVPTTAASHPANHITPSMNHYNKIHTNPLDSIPFRLSSSLEPRNTQNVPADIARIRYSLNVVKSSLESSEWNYDFRLERNVVNEESMINGV